MIAAKFSATRSAFWRDLDFIRDIAADGDRILDYGCGNGRLLSLFEDRAVDYFGVDVSGKLIEKAKGRFPEYSERFSKISSEASLSFPDGFFNAVFSIAVFHHFPRSHADRMARELFRVTGDGGTIAITVWNVWQKRYRRHIWGPRAVLGKIFNLGEYRSLGLKDAVIPFENDDGKIFHRYHRAYTKKDIRAIFSKAGFSIEECFISGGKNIVLVAKKR